METLKNYIKRFGDIRLELNIAELKELDVRIQALVISMQFTLKCVQCLAYCLIAQSMPGIIQQFF